MKRLMTCACVAFMAIMSMAQSVMDVNTKKLGAPIQKTMYGIFFEENFRSR